MLTILILVIIIIAGGAAIFFMKGGGLESTQEVTKPEYLPYSKRQYLMTYAEHGFFQKLERVIGNKYYIFPQVHYTKLMYASGQQNFKNPYFNKIDRKSADFVLFDREHVSPVLVIEVDDSTHSRPDRIKRDDFIDKVLGKCSIPIAHIRPFATEEELRGQLGAKIKI